MFSKVQNETFRSAQETLPSAVLTMVIVLTCPTADNIAIRGNIFLRKLMRVAIARHDDGYNDLNEPFPLEMFCSRFFLWVLAEEKFVFCVLKVSLAPP